MFLVNKVAFLIVFFGCLAVVSSNHDPKRILMTRDVRVNPKIIEPDDLTCEENRTISIYNISKCEKQSCNNEDDWTEWKQMQKIKKLCKICTNKRHCDIDDVFKDVAHFRDIIFLRIFFDCVDENAPETKKKEGDTKFLVEVEIFEHSTQSEIQRTFYCKKINNTKDQANESNYKEIKKTFSTPEKNISVNVKAYTNYADDVMLTVKPIRFPSAKAQTLLKKPTSIGLGRSQVDTLVYPNQTYLSVLGFNSKAEKIQNITVNFTYTIKEPKAVFEKIASLSNEKRTYVQQASLKCVFIDSKSGTFSEEGCTSLFSPDFKNVTCTCNHATVFVLLLSLILFTIPEVVQVISYVTEIISVICLLISFFVLLYVREKIKSKRLFIQLNLISSFFFLHIVSLLHDVSLKHTTSCEASTIALHFFVLASGGWMLMEGVNLFIINSNRSLQFHGLYRHKVVYFSYFIGWVVPFIIVTISALVGFTHHDYVERVPEDQKPFLGGRKYELCWLSQKHYLRLGAVIVPLVVIICINILIALHTAHVVVKIKRRESKRKRKRSVSNAKEVKQGVLTVLLLTPTLGLSWILMLFINSPGNSSLIFLYLNAIVNGLQGLYISAIYCCRKNIRNALWLSACRNKS